MVQDRSFFAIMLKWLYSQGVSMEIRKHFLTITQHKWLVMKHCFAVGLYRQGLMHDLSKYSPIEFWNGCRYYQGDRSPNNAEREDKGYSASWLHHKGRNRHHLEYWIDYDLPPNTGMTGMRMPERYVVEMFCDRMAACKVYQKEAYTQESPWIYYEKSREHLILHPESRALLEDMLQTLAKDGEKAAFLHIRKDILKVTKGDM